MSAPNFRWDRHRQDGSYWTGEERTKAVFVAKQAMRRGRDPIQAVIAYMGMDETNAEICARRAEEQLRGDQRRICHAYVR